MNHFLARRRPVLLAALVAAAATCFSTRRCSPKVRPAAMKTVAVVGATSYNDLVGDVNFIGSLADRPELGQMLQGTIALFTQGRGLEGVDQSKPWGVILQTDGQQFMPVACIAVTDLDKVLNIVKGFGAQIQDGADGAKQIALPNGQTLHVKHAGGWAYIAQIRVGPGQPARRSVGRAQQDHQPSTTWAPASRRKTSPSNFARWRSRP